MAADNHGTYTGPGMNHDSYVRPRWDEEYVFAFAATVQWVRAVKEWSDEVDPTFWTKAQTLPAPAGLDIDFLASIRISEWISGSSDLNGHWKGNGSGSLALLAPFATVWTGSADSPVVQQFKVAKVHALLTPGLYNDVAIPFPPVRRAAVHRECGDVHTTEVHAKNDLDPGEPPIDPLGDPDFYAVVTIEGSPYLEATRRDRATIQPSWTSCRFLPPGTAKAAVVYSLFDEDGRCRVPMTTVTSTRTWAPSTYRSPSACRMARGWSRRRARSRTGTSRGGHVPGEGRLGGTLAAALNLRERRHGGGWQQRRRRLDRAGAAQRRPVGPGRSRPAARHRRLDRPRTPSRRSTSSR